MKCGQLIEYNVKNEAERLVTDLLFFKKTLYEVKASGKHHSFIMFW